MLLEETMPVFLEYCNLKLTGSRIDNIRKIRPELFQIALYNSKVGAQYIYFSTYPDILAAVCSSAKINKISYEAGSFIMGLRKYLKGSYLNKSCWNEKSKSLCVEFLRYDKTNFFLVLKKGLLVLMNSQKEVLYSNKKSHNINFEISDSSSGIEIDIDFVKYFNEKLEVLDRVIFENLQLKVIKQIKKNIKKYNVILKKIDLDEEKFSKHKEVLKKGELLKAQLYKVKKGDLFVDVNDYFSTSSNMNDTVRIELDSKLSPLDNMNLYFKKAKKYKTGIQKVRIRRDEVKKELAFWENKLSIIINYSTDEINELYKIGEVNKKSKTSKHIKKNLKDNKSKNYRIINMEHVIIYIGRNSKGNELVSFSIANGNDLWFHCHNYPGSHVVLAKKKKVYDFTQKDIRNAAVCALFYSKGRNNIKDEVVYTQAKYVKKIKGASAGKVTISSGKTILVKADENELKKIRNQGI